MSWKAQMNDRGVIARYRDTDSGEILTPAEFERRMQMAQLQYTPAQSQLTAVPPASPYAAAPNMGSGAAFGQGYGGGMHQQGYAGGGMQQQGYGGGGQQMLGGGQIGQQLSQLGGLAQQLSNSQLGGGQMGGMQPAPSMVAQPSQPAPVLSGNSPLIQPGAKMLNGTSGPDMLSQPAQGPSQAPPSIAGANGLSPLNSNANGMVPTAGMPMQGKSLRLEGIPGHGASTSGPPAYKQHGFLDATSIAILLPTLVLLALIIAAAHKKRLFPWQTIRTFNPPSGLLTPRDYERSYLCPPNLRRHGRLGKRNPSATWTEADGVVLPFGFLARTHLPVTIPMGRLPNKNMFIVAPSGSGKTTLMRAVIKALLAKPCVIIALEAKANDPNLDEKREGFKYSLLPEAQHAGFNTLYFNPLDVESIHWNPLDLDAIQFASSIVQDVNSLPPEEQHWAERDHGYIYGLTQLLKWGAVQVVADDENGAAAEVQPLPCNPRGLMRLVNNRRNIVESLRRLKSNPDMDAAELSEMTQTLSSIIRTDTDWDKNIQGVRGRLRMFKNPGVLRVTEQSNVDIKAAMHLPTVLIFGAPASLGPDAESLSSCFVYQLQQALHTRYGTKNVLPLFAFFDEYQTLNIDIAGRLSAIVRGANGGLTVILQNISQIDGGSGGGIKGPAASGEVKTIFSNSAIRVCLHNADETTARFFSEEIGKHAVVVPGIADHYMANGFGIFPTSWNRIHSQQVVARVDPDAIKRMEKHHALVYLAPAGDPEFGEIKPFMCDLRGIEEIARLHLLHNVSSRRPDDPTDPNGGGGGPDDGMPPHPHLSPTGGEELAAMGFPPVGHGYPHPHAPQPVAPAAMAPAAQAPMMQPAAVAAAPAVRSCGTCGKNPGKGKFCIECGAFVGAAAAAAAAPQVELATMATILDPHHASVAPAEAQPAQPAFPTFAAPQVDPALAVSAAAAQTAQAGTLRKATVLQSPQEIANAAQQALGTSPYQTDAAPTFPTSQSVVQGARRQPVTSFNLDPSRLGVAGQPTAGVEF